MIKWNCDFVQFNKAIKCDVFIVLWLSHICDRGVISACVMWVRRCRWCRHRSHTFTFLTRLYLDCNHIAIWINNRFVLRWKLAIIVADCVCVRLFLVERFMSLFHKTFYTLQKYKRCNICTYSALINANWQFSFCFK